MRKTVFICAALLAMSAASVQAQGPGSGGPQPGGSPTNIPIDGGASLLLALGAGVAVRKLRRRTHSS